MAVNPQLAQPQTLSQADLPYTNSPYFMTDTTQSYQERLNQSPYFQNNVNVQQQQSS